MAVLAGLAAAGVDAAEFSPPPVSVLTSRAGVGEGLIFLSPQGDAQADPVHPVAPGPLIIDNLGRPVWFSPQPTGTGVSVTDFRVQTYQGRPVLTWMQGGDQTAVRTTTTTDYILDDSYTVIARVQAGNGLNANRHDFQITPQNTALLVIYNLIPCDLSSVGGSATGKVYEAVIQELEIASGAVLMEWHSLPDVPLTDSYVTAVPGVSFDYFHPNSVSLDTDGNVLVSGRHTSAIYKINRKSGQLMWRLGGKRSDFQLGPGLPFAWQHDARAVDANTLRIFDNESSGRSTALPYSRVIWVRRDEGAMTATLQRELQHPAALSSHAMGNADELSNGNTFVGWGDIGRFSEFDAGGQLIFDATLPTGYNSYRAHRSPWIGRPATSPTLTVDLNSDATTTVHAIWNGATEVVTWRVWGGSSLATLGQVAAASWNGLDTAIRFSGQYALLQLEALGANGNSLGRSVAWARPKPAADLPARLVNISTRAQVGGEAGTPIAGFTIAGSGAKNVLVRAVGPGLIAFGLSGALADPRLSLVQGAQTVATNESWPAQDAEIMSSVGAFPLPVASKDAAILAALTAGSYSAPIGATNGDSGVALLEVYDADSATTATITNVSTRGYVGTGAASLIPGFSISGRGTVRLLIRAVGPSLAGFGVADVLPDPVITLHQGGSIVGSNDDWSSEVNAPTVAACAAAVGAFALPVGSKDAAMIVDLPAGTYTAVVSGAANATGNALVEIYVVP